MYSTIFKNLYHHLAIFTGTVIGLTNIYSLINTNWNSKYLTDRTNYIRKSTTRARFVTKLTIYGCDLSISIIKGFVYGYTFPIQWTLIAYRSWLSQKTGNMGYMIPPFLFASSVWEFKNEEGKDFNNSTDEIVEDMLGIRPLGTYKK